MRNILQNKVCQFYSHSIRQQISLTLHIKQILLTCNRNYLKSMPKRDTQYKHLIAPCFTCWSRVGHVLTRVNSCWLVSDSCWFVSNSSWFLLTRVNLCWYSCNSNTRVPTQVNTNQHRMPIQVNTNQRESTQSNKSPTQVNTNQTSPTRVNTRQTRVNTNQYESHKSQHESIRPRSLS